MLPHMAEITKDSFLLLSKDDMWELFNKSRQESQALEKISDKLDVVLKNMEKLENQVAVGKAVNVALKKEVLSLKKKVNRDSQYHRQDNLEFSGIPESVEDEKLEKR